MERGFTWTLTSRLGDMLMHAEKMFGPRDKSYTILGIEFNDSGPRIWYPKNNRNIVIQLTPDSLNSEMIALYQLAHECIHLLSPSGDENALVLEEGTAVWFSWWYLSHVFGIDGKDYTQDGHYKDAGLLVERMLNSWPDVICKLRSIRNNWWELTSRDILECCPISVQDSQTLALSFDDYKKRRPDFHQQPNFIDSTLSL